MKLKLPVSAVELAAAIQSDYKVAQPMVPMVLLPVMLVAALEEII
jgi:hypothetical protein